MSEVVRTRYLVIVDVLAVELSRQEFIQRGSEEWIRFRDGSLQRLAISLRQPTNEDGAYIELFAGVNFPEIEALAARLQGKKPRPGFITCSLNIGLLTPKAANVQWLLRAEESVDLTVQLLTQTVTEFAIPFWKEFASIDGLLSRFEAGDFRVCRGTEWIWRQVAAYCLVGQANRACALLNDRLGVAGPATKSVINAALQQITDLSRAR